MRCAISQMRWPMNMWAFWMRGTDEDGIQRAISAVSNVASCSAHSQQLSLSRLSHRLPRCEAHPEIMQGTADFHHEIADAVLPQPDPVFHNTTALDAPVDMLDPQPTVMQRLVGQLLFQVDFLA